MTDSLYEEARDIDQAEYDIVDHSEVGIGDEEPRERQETETHYADGTQKLDAFGAPIRKVVRVRDGGRDRPARPPR